MDSTVQILGSTSIDEEVSGTGHKGPALPQHFDGVDKSLGFRALGLAEREDTAERLRDDRLLGPIEFGAVVEERVVHGPIHASWLNQIEIYFSIVQRKVLTPNDFSSLQELQQRLLAFQSHYERSALPFNWTFTRRDLNALLAKIDLKRLAPAA